MAVVLPLQSLLKIYQGVIDSDCEASLAGLSCLGLCGRDLGEGPLSGPFVF